MKINSGRWKNFQHVYFDVEEKLLILSPGAMPNVLKSLKKEIKNILSCATNIIKL